MNAFSTGPQNCGSSAFLRFSSLSEQELNNITSYNLTFQDILSFLGTQVRL